MILSVSCAFCTNNVPPSASRCPHCGQPSLFPNVVIAHSEQSSLQNRYDNAISLALTSGAITNVNDFERTVNKSCAVVNRSLSELQRLVGSDFEVYATYYRLSEGIRLQKGEEFDSLRQAADSIFFTGYAKEIRFAALSLDSLGLQNYGDCSWILREAMIEHRASVFEENTTLYYMNNARIKGASDIPKGLRANWADRAKLCVAKLAAKIDTTTTPAQYSDILLHQGVTSSDDDFIEVHIFGPMTIRTIEEVTFTGKKKNKAEQAIIKGIKEKLGKYGVKVN
jgi:RNA polymerase subunit RPABC4/transcription elongation factor Spt4